MADLASLLQQYGYYANGGGRKVPNAADVMTSLGQAAAGAGQGFQAAAAPGLEQLKNHQDFAKAILAHSMTQGNTYTGQQLQQIAQSGTFPPEMVFGGKKAGTPKTTVSLKGLEEGAQKRALASGYTMNQEIPIDEARVFQSASEADTNRKFRQQEFDSRQKEAQRKEFESVVQRLNPDIASPRSSIGQAGSVKRRAQQALDILNQPIVTPQQAGSVAADIASIMQAGAATQHGMKTQDYNTLQGSVARFSQWVSGHPKDAVPPDIKQSMVQVINTLKKSNRKILEDQYNTSEKTNQKLFGMFPDEWKNFKEQQLAAFDTEENDLDSKAGQFLTQHGQKDTPANRQHAIQSGWVQ